MNALVHVDPELCIGCGICVRNCPKSAVGAMHITEEKKASATEECVGCLVCVKSCPKQAITPLDETPADALICQSCPIHCRIRPGQTGACRRFRNDGKELKREVPLHVIPRPHIRLDPRTRLPDRPLLTGIGAGTNLQKQAARFVAEEELDGVDIVTCVTEAALSFSGLRVKIDTSDYIGAEGSAIRREGKIVGYVTSSWYGSRTATIGGVTLLKGPDGFVVARTVTDLAEGETVPLQVEGGAKLELTRGKAPVINGQTAELTTFGCGSSVGKLFSARLLPILDECIMLDMGITGQMSEHHAALGAKPCGITVIGKRSSGGRYLVPSGKGWGGTCVEDPRDAIASIDKNVAWPGMRILITETKAEHAAYFELDENLELVEKPMPPAVEAEFVRMKEFCDPGLVNVLYVGGVGGGVMSILHPHDSPGVLDAIREGRILVTSCGRPVHRMPGGNLIIEVDTAGLPKGSFSWVPTPCTTMPVEFTMTRETYMEVCGYPDAPRPLSRILAENAYVYMDTEERRS